MIKSRTWSFVLVTLVYALSAFVGIGVYFSLPFAFWLNLLLADIAATVITFLFSLLFKNASVYDPYWSVQPIVILVAFFIGKSATLARVLPLIAVCLWGIRLTANWAYTFHGLEHQDWRYTRLQKTTGIFYPFVNFFGIHLVPTLIVYACVLPAVFTMVYGPTANAGSVIFFLISVFAVVLQGVSDIQMQAFRKGGKGGFICDGLWKYSRHPNYLGEILMWWGVGLAAVSAMPEHWYLLVGALLNTLLFLFISIPLADGKQAQKEGFEAYKKQTRALLPFAK